MLTKKLYLCCAGFLLLWSCQSQPKKTQKRDSKKEVPVFCADSAYHYIETQVNIGPRVPQTTQHKACLEYLSTYFKQLGATVHIQQGSMPHYLGKDLVVQNIIVQFDPAKKRRLFLAAHWDTRPYADQDSDPKNWKTPIDGANDGASGVGVIQEIARIYANNPADIGLDVLLFDTEDWGPATFQKVNAEDESWCLGSQYWSKNIYPSNYTPQYGILLDMVGGKNARFHREIISDYFASFLVDKVWNTAQKIGLQHYFVNTRGGTITDDHLYVNQITQIPCIDIIEYEPESENGFAAYWHTLDDNIEAIDKSTLQAVGQTLLELIYNEK